MSQEWQMSLFGFTHLESFHDQQTDTRALLAWRDGCLLLSFRGTASKANAVTDVKVDATTFVQQAWAVGRRLGSRYCLCRAARTKP